MCLVSSFHRACDYRSLDSDRIGLDDRAAAWPYAAKARSKAEDDEAPGFLFVSRCKAGNGAEKN